MALLLKNVIKQFFGEGVRRLLPYYLRSKPGISIILMYHRVVEKLPEDLHDPAMFVSAATFEMHIKEISRFFHIVPLQDLARTRGAERLCAITFDDGWVDNYHVAFPILKTLGAPAFIFLPAIFIGSERCFWFESLWNLANCAKALKREKDFIQHFSDVIPEWSTSSLHTSGLMTLISILKRKPQHRLDDLIEDSWRRLGLVQSGAQTVLNWDQVIDMGQHQITFGSHGLNHHILNVLDAPTKRRDIHESFQVLRHGGIPIVPWFSYPNGDWDKESVAHLLEAGYEGAVTTRLGYTTQHDSPFLLNRIGVHEYISNTPNLFWFRVFQAILAGPGPSGNSTWEGN